MTITTLVLAYFVLLPNFRAIVDADSVGPDPPPPEYAFLNVKQFGAVGDGVHNETEAFLSAIRKASDYKYATIYVPEGDFVCWPLSFENCHNLRLQIDGRLLAPQEPRDWPQRQYFLGFVGRTNNCSISGDQKGVIDGRGAGWWEDPLFNTARGPALLYYSGSVSSYPYNGAYNISLRDAPGSHVMVEDTAFYQFAEFDGLNIESTDSGKVDGVAAVNASLVLRRSTVNVGAASFLGEAGKGDSNRVFCRVENCHFGRGNGILLLMTDGILANTSFYQNVFVQTAFGLRVLGEVDGTGEIVNVFFSETQMSDVGVPVIVENTFCPAGKTCSKQTKGVSINYVSIENLNAVQTGGSAGRFHCRQDNECTIMMDNVDVRPANPSVANHFSCSNAKGEVWQPESISPPSCLKKD